MALELSTAGVLLKYCVEATAGTRPETAYTTITNIKSFPDMNPEPSTYDVTDLSDLVWKRYIPALKDPGGAFAFTANLNDAFQTAWESLVSAANTAAESDLATWFEVYIPGMTDGFFFAGMPSELGLSAIEVDSVLETTVYITPNQIEGFATKI